MTPSSDARSLRFTGSEYFKIWIVNLALTLVTIGIYSPWAKVRRLRYFYGNTLVDGGAGKQVEIPEYLSTHPATEARIRMFESGVPSAE